MHEEDDLLAEKNRLLEHAHTSYSGSLEHMVDADWRSGVTYEHVQLLLVLCTRRLGPGFKCCTLDIRLESR